MKQILFVTILILTFLNSKVMAQKSDRDQIKHSGDYYYGTGTSVNLQEAKANAQDELVNQISTFVVSKFETKIKEGGKELSEKVSSVLRTYSMAKLKDLKLQVKELPEGQYEVFCYIKKSKVKQIFDQRRRLIAKFAKDGKYYEEQANLAFALKLNYFALILMNSLPDEVVAYDSVNYTAEIPDRINRILSGIQFKLVKNQLEGQNRTLTLKITYHKNPVTLLDFFFWDGQNNINVQGNDGLATIQLFGSATKINRLKIKIKYDYYDERKEYPVVFDLWDLVKKPIFKNNRRVIAFTQHPLQASKARVSTVFKNSSFNTNRLEIAPQVPPYLVSVITSQTTQFINLLKKKDLHLLSQTFGNDQFLNKKLINYVKYNNPEPLQEDTSKIQINQTKNGYELRRIRVVQKYPSIHKFVTQYLVLDFSSSGKLQDVNVSIPRNLYCHFMRLGKKGNDWPNRRQIIKFIEKYRTAYLTRDLSTLNLMFADDALIIVGRRIQKKNLPPDMVSYVQLNQQQPDYKLIRLTKKEYLSRLENIFNAQQDIFLNFGSFDIVRKNKPTFVYGVEMQQDYFSTNYADEGFLFLLFDFYENRPTIYVRAWQPKPHSAAELVKASNFKIRH